MLGIGFEPAPGGAGLSVISVLPGSNAERDGVERGDILLALDGTPLKDSIDLIYALKPKRVGDHVALQVKRKGQILSIDVTFTENTKHHP
jgi:putative serine protease PepD